VFLLLALSVSGQAPTRIRVAHILSRVDPIYPKLAEEKGVRGTVRLDVVIGKDGHVMKIETLGGDPILVEAARTAVAQWVYTPTLLNGQPIEVVMEVGVPFGVKEKAPTRKH
jgi:protein TonB